jgi:hypothetical protein
LTQHQRGTGGGVESVCPWTFLVIMTEVEMVVWTARGQRPGMLLSIQCCTGQPLQPELT